MEIARLASVLALTMIAGIPPLNDDQAARVRDAVDGSDQHDEAFRALLENVRAWTGSAGDAPIRVQPDLQKIMQSPDEYRGDLCRVRGVLQQSTKLPPPYEQVREWFLRCDDGTAAIVYVVLADASSSSRVRQQQQVEVDARFYKRMALEARDGKRRSYPAFIGAFPRPIVQGTQAGGVSPASVIAGLVVIMAVVFIALFFWARKSAGSGVDRLRARSMRIDIREGQALSDDTSEPLPSDPASALAELKRRAES